MVVTRSGFAGLVANAFAGVGFYPEAPTIYEFPIEMFLIGADLTPLRENIDKIVYGLTKWQPKNKAKGIYYPGDKVVAQGKDYQGAVDKMDLLFLKSNWSDSLPITPATQERVDWILTGTDLARNTPIGAEGKIYPRGGISTVEALAIQLAMAGGRPEYLPLLIAVVEAITAKEFEHNVWNATTVSNFPAVIVNGPMSKQIRLGSRYGIMGPDPIHPAGGPIGRAIRLILQNLGGAVAATGTMGIYGGMRFTNAIFAEDEEGLPPGWDPLSVKRGFAKGSNAITVLPVMGASNVQLHSGFGPSTAELEKQFLYRIAGSIAWIGAIDGGLEKLPGNSSGIALLGRNMAYMLAQQGWTREKVQTFLDENSTALCTWDMLVRTGRVDPAKGPQPPRILAPALLAIAGGDQSGQAYWMPSGRTQNPWQAEIKLPAKAKWDALLKAAEADLGPLPV